MPANESGCAEMQLLIQAEIDGELSVADSARVLLHRERCARCATTFEQLTALRGALRATLGQERAPAQFKAALHARFNTAAPRANVRPPSLRSRAALFGAGAALAASVLLMVHTRTQPDLADTVLTEHIRSLQAEHLIDIASSDQHTVKPWFNGKLDFVPPVKDFAAQGFPLTGGRLDYLAGRPVAALIYHRNRHPINLFIWPAGAPSRDSSAPTCTQRAGYNLCWWQGAQMNFWAVSDLNENELSQFASGWLI